MSEALDKLKKLVDTLPPEEQAQPSVANTFRGFIDLICNETVRFLNEISFCYTRYSDGSTKTQWIPKRYIANRNV